ncbi:MFS transporter [Muricoccus radiodurans]|uniref:MFS transporter n=1 Tax=Muricoccus radiodurans TaxID=2231721 RepID=UPI003CF8439A
MPIYSRLGGPLWRALSSRNARIFFSASLVAWTGLWMHRIAVAWLAWELTGSAAWVGAVAFADLAPAVLCSPVAGAVADRMDRVLLTQFSQGAIALGAGLEALLVGTGSISIGLLLAIETWNGVAASFSQPARQTLMPALVAREDLPSAVAANSLLFNVARFIGPGMAGPVIAIAGVWPAMLCNALGNLLATATMPALTIDPAHRRGHPATASLLAETVEGLAYAARHPGLGPLFGFAALAAILLRGVPEILPPYVERLFGRGAESLGALTASFAVGALTAGLIVASRGRLRGTTRIAIAAVAAQAVAMAGFVATGEFLFAMVCAAMLGACGSAHGISVQVLAQTAAAPSMRGRIMSVWGMISRAGPALGALMLGGAGEIWGLRWPTLAAVGLGVALVAWAATRAKDIARALEVPREERG